MQRRGLVLLLPLGTQVRGPIKNQQGNTKHVLFDFITVAMLVTLTFFLDYGLCGGFSTHVFPLLFTLLFRNHNHDWNLHYLLRMAKFTTRTLFCFLICQICLHMYMSICFCIGCIHIRIVLAVIKLHSWIFLLMNSTSILCIETWLWVCDAAAVSPRL